MRVVSFLISAVAIGGILVATQGCLSSTDATNVDRLCTPGAYVFCRCADRTEGTKLCQNDGKSFEACQTDDSGECVGGEIPDERTNEPIPKEEEPDPDPDPDPKNEPANAMDSCPGKSQAAQPNVELKIEGTTVGAPEDREGKAGACAVGAGGKDHVYRIIPSGSGKLEVKVQGSDGLNPVAYLRSKCDDVESQVTCGPPGPKSLAQLTTNVQTGKSYYLFIDGASSTAGKYVATVKLTTQAFCGDGEVDPGEACDDGNKTEDDGCANDCRKVNGNPTSGGSCPGHPVAVNPGQAVTGTGSTNTYGNTWNKPSQACDTEGTNNFQDHVYAVTPKASGTLKVTLTPTVATNLMLTARTSCSDATTTTASMCKNDQSISLTPEVMTLAAANGQTIYVAVDGGGLTSNKGDYSIKFELQ